MLNATQPVALKVCWPLEIHHHESTELRKVVVGVEWMVAPSQFLLQGSDLAKTSARKELVVSEICWKANGEDPVAQRIYCPEQWQ